MSSVTAPGETHDRPAWDLHEAALVVLGLGTFVALTARAGISHAVIAEAGLATLTFVVVVFYLMRGGDGWPIKARMVAAYLFVLWFYLAVARFVPALGVPLRDGDLLAADEACLGTSPAVWCQRWITPVLTDFMSGCYLSYHVYLSAALLHALWMPAAFARRFASYVFLAYAIGLPGYLLVPAVGPAAAFPDRFSVPLEGGPVTRFNAMVVSNGSSVYDVFPSLHLLITFVLLTHDWRFVRRRFWIMLLPVCGLIASTMYLRYHYAVDLAGGVVVLGVVLLWHMQRATPVRPANLPAG